MLNQVGGVDGKQSNMDVACLKQAINGIGDLAFRNCPL